METELLDLTTVPDPLALSNRWVEGVPRLFEGLSVVAPRGGLRSGRIATFGFGPGRIAGIEGSAQRVVRRVARTDRTSGSFNALLQVRGRCRLEHAGRTTALMPGSLALVDGAGRFEMQLPGPFKHVLFQFPRDIVLRRHDRIGSLAGRTLDRGPATDLVFRALSDIAGTIERLDAQQRAHAFEAALAHLGMLADPRQARSRDHFSLATADIEAELSDPDLDATVVANRVGVSRRRLDQLFRAHGFTVSGWIWERRLQRIADELRAPKHEGRKLIDVALSYGFSSAAHFSRAFRRRFGMSPRAWRAHR